MIKVYNGVYDSFKVTLTCTSGSLSAWYVTGSNLASATVTSFGCGDFFTLSSAQTQSIILSNQGMDATATLTYKVSNATDCITCVASSGMKFWNNNALCSNSSAGATSSLQGINQCVTANSLPSPMMFSNITYTSSSNDLTVTRTYNYTLNAT